MKTAALAALDPAARARIESACGFVNQKAERHRGQVRMIALAAAVAALFLWADGRVHWTHALLGALMVTGFFAQRARRDISRWYKKLVISRLVEALGDGLTYSHTSTLTDDDFRSLDLLPGRISEITAEDEVAGARNGVAFGIHEVKAIRRNPKHDEVLFKGVVAILEFNKNFRGHTVVLPDAEGRLLGGVLGEAEERGGKRKVILTHPEFERRFTAYSTDDQQAHYVLTPRLMDLIVRARAALDAELRLAFVRNVLVVAVPLPDDLFEVGLTSKVTPLRAFDELAGVVKLATDLIDTLDLETRIWSRA